MPATATDTLLINGTRYSLRGANPNLGGSSNRLGTVYGQAVDLSGSVTATGATFSGLVRPQSIELSANGSEASPAFRLNDSNSGFYRSGDGYAYSENGVTTLIASAGKLTLRNGVTPTELLLHGTYTSSTNYERLRIYTQTGGDHVIASEAGAGGGSVRGIRVKIGTTDIARWAGNGLAITNPTGIGLTITKTYTDPATVMKVADSNDAESYFTIEDGSGGATFLPLFRGRCSSFSVPALYMIGDTPAGVDTGASPLVRVSGRINNGAVATRPLFDVANLSTVMFSVSAAGAGKFSAGIGFWGVTPPTAKPSAPTDTATIIALLQSYGMCA